MANPGALDGLTVLAFESRRAVEMAELIRRHGGTPLSAPSMREVALEATPAALDLLQRLRAGTVDVVILLTGVGTRALVTALAPACPRDELAALLKRTTLAVRGPKPVAALRDLGVTAALIAPEPNTWRELLARLDAHGPLQGKIVAIQEYGRANLELADALRARGATPLPVPVYRWDYPDDLGPLREGVAQLADGAPAIAVFTSARQVEHVLHTADRLGRAGDLVAAAARVVYASIGPVCSEAMLAHGLPVDLEPEHSKLGHLVSAIAGRGPALVTAKRAAAVPV